MSPRFNSCSLYTLLTQWRQIRVDQDRDCAGGQAERPTWQYVAHRRLSLHCSHVAAGPHTTEGAPPPNSDHGDKTAENIRYGQNISESGMGGMTTTSSGKANSGEGYGGTERDPALEKTGNNRSAQGYGPGSGVGG